MNITKIFIFFGIFFSLTVFSFAELATMDQFTTTDKIDDFSKKPIGSRNNFSSDSPEIWATAYLSNAQSGTVISVEWLFRENNGDTIITLAQNEIQAEGTRYVNFRLAPNQGQAFPVGLYQALFKINGAEAGFVNFQVTALSISTAESTTEIQYMNYKDKMGRFTVDLPGTWFPANIADPNVIIFIALNTQDNPLAKIAISLYDAEIKKDYTAKNAVTTMRNILVQESKGANAILLADQLAQDSAEATIWILSFTYTAHNGKEVEDRKMIICVKDQLYILTFINEKQFSPEMKSISQRVIDSFKPV